MSIPQQAVDLRDITPAVIQQAIGIMPAVTAAAAAAAAQPFS
jgi:hypothetical protein